ncbi:MAG: aspartate/glutamate racemase family protein [Acetobacteraceae bacterium]|nr:aspartate/glutamate racemase family protein [Acetobacteraceae bacterium]
MTDEIPLGILMLDTDFPRPPGDVGHAASWRMPVLFARVKGASVRAVVRDDPEKLLDLFAEAGNGLADRGAVGLITSCGFLAALQKPLAARLTVPLAASSLLQIPKLPGPVGVITYDSRTLGPAHFLGVGADPATPVVGLPDNGAFHAMIEGGAGYDAAALCHEAVDAARQLQNSVPNLAAIVLECTNLPPFSADIARATGLPVYDILTLGHEFHAGLAAGVCA